MMCVDSYAETSGNPGYTRNVETRFAKTHEQGAGHLLCHAVWDQCLSRPCRSGYHLQNFLSELFYVSGPLHFFCPTPT